MAVLTRVIDEGGSSEEILDIKRQNYSILEDERASKAFLNLENAKKGYNEVIF